MMTKLAIYESTKGKKQLNISKYYKRDYVRYNMFKTAVAATIAYMIIVGIYILQNVEEILLQLNDLDFLNAAMKIGVSYIIFLVLYMVAARFVYSHKYEKVKPDVIIYNHNLKQLKELYDREEKELKEKRVGRSVKLNHDDLIDY
ncbi:MAG: hypothetical protein NC089_12415 [Bacteroides sp.]|nr:hypothetical protein [Bacteroides sp.]MCM1550259.1 hypothetical protein [Clostridium sp.]